MNMKMITAPLGIALAFMSTVACSAGAGGTKADSAAASDSALRDGKTLVAYFSAQGHTKAVAEKIASLCGADLFEIVPEQPYTEADLDGWNESARGTRESKDRTTRPAVASKVEDMGRYDTIYLGFPIWWYTAPTIINTFLEQYDTSGKTIIPFATSGGSGFGSTQKDLEVSAPDATFKPGAVMNSWSDERIKKWIEGVSK